MHQVWSLKAGQRACSASSMQRSGSLGGHLQECASSTGNLRRIPSSSKSSRQLRRLASGGVSSPRASRFVQVCSTLNGSEDSQPERIPPLEPSEQPSTSGRSLDEDSASSASQATSWPEFAPFKPTQGWMRLSVPHTSSANSSATPPPAAASAPDPKPDASETAWTEFSAELHTPPPANLPTNGEEGNLPSNAPPGYLSLRTAAADISSAMDSANYGALFFPPKARRNIWTVTDQPGIDLFLAGPRTWARLQQVYVILFGVGQRDTEGIYSLRAFSADGVPHETIISFESEEDALRYAGLLEASMDHTPNVCSIPPGELITFCMDQAYACRLEPLGTLLIPPDFNVGVTDWERSIRLREGKFSVLEEEPIMGAPSSLGTNLSTSSSSQSATAQATQAPPMAAPPAPGSLPRGSYEAKSHPSNASSAAFARYTHAINDAELDEIRARLEALLPNGD